MATVESRITVDDKGDVLLIPAEVAFGEDCEVAIERVGDVLTIRPRQTLEDARASGRP